MPEQTASQSGPPSRSAPVDRDSIAPSLSAPEVSQAAQAGQITPALVAEVTEKVYRLLLADLRLERERRR
jgi:hypothetical protein